MAVNVPFNGTTYTIPTVGDVGWGSMVTAFIQDVGNAAMTTSQPQTITGAKTFNGTTIVGGQFQSNAITDNSATNTHSVTIDVSGNVTFTKAVTGTFSGQFIGSIALAVTAAGTSQGTANGLTALYNEVTTISGSANGVQLPVAVNTVALSPGADVVIYNLNASNNLNAYPPTGMSIDSLGTNVAYVIPPLKASAFKLTNASGSGTWRSFNAVATYS